MFLVFRNFLAHFVTYGFKQILNAKKKLTKEICNKYNHDDILTSILLHYPNSVETIYYYAILFSWTQYIFIHLFLLKCLSVQWKILKNWCIFAVRWFLSAYVFVNNQSFLCLTLFYFIFFSFGVRQKLTLLVGQCPHPSLCPTDKHCMGGLLPLHILHK